MREASDIQSDRDFLRSELENIHTAAAAEERELTDDETARWDEGAAALERLSTEDAQRAQLAEFAAVQSVNHERTTAAPESTRTVTTEAREASRANEVMNAYERSLTGRSDHVAEARDVARSMLDDRFADMPEARERAEDMLRGVGISDGSRKASSSRAVELAAQHLLVFGSAHYERAFAASVRQAQGGLVGQLDADALRAMAAADRYRELNVSNGTEGGLQVPTHLNPTLRLMNKDSQDGVSGLARHETLVSGANTWNGVSSAGISVEYPTSPNEAAEVAEATVAMVDLSVPTHKGDIYVEATIEYDQDVGAGSQLGSLFDDAMERNSASIFVSGTGVDQPSGIATELDAISNSEVSVDTTLVIDEQDIRDLKFVELPAGFRGAASWVMNDAIRSHIQAFSPAGQGALFTADLRDGYFERLLGSPVYAATALSADTTPGAATDKVVILGDFSNYVIVHKLDATLEYIQNVMGSNQRPTGKRGWVLWFRHGAGLGSSNNTTAGPGNAFRMLEGKA